MLAQHERVAASGRRRLHPRRVPARPADVGLALDTESFADSPPTAFRTGDDAQGDARGSQPAVLEVVPGRRCRSIREQTVPGLRVDDHPDPITAITRLAQASGAPDHLGGVVVAERLMAGAGTDVTQEESGSARDALEAARQVLGEEVRSPSEEAVLLGRVGASIDTAASSGAVLERGERWRPYLGFVATAVSISRATVAGPVSP